VLTFGIITICDVIVIDKILLMIDKILSYFPFLSIVTEPGFSQDGHFGDRDRRTGREYSQVARTTKGSFLVHPQNVS
jgi:hypothetical protein